MVSRREFCFLYLLKCYRTKWKLSITSDLMEASFPRHRALVRAWRNCCYWRASSCAVCNEERMMVLCASGMHFEHWHVGNAKTGRAQRVEIMHRKLFLQSWGFSYGVGRFIAMIPSCLAISITYFAGHSQTATYPRAITLNPW